MKKVLIVGYGRAGKRHAKIAQDLGLDVFTFDPNVSDSPYKHYTQYGMATLDNEYDYVVIATPPSTHLGYIEDFAHVPILCEKPLCDLDQIDLANNLFKYQRVCGLTLRCMVAYNYRWHRAINNICVSDDSELHWHLQSENYRPGGIPEWGLLLDHVSHAVNTIYFLDNIKKLNHVEYYKCDDYESWTLWGECLDGYFTISERLWNEPRSRSSELFFNYGKIDIYPDPQMFIDMWTDFLNGNYAVSNYKNALETQRILVQANEMVK
jgi:hypothetical protein